MGAVMNVIYGQKKPHHCDAYTGTEKKSYIFRREFHHQYIHHNRLIYKCLGSGFYFKPCLCSQPCLFISNCNKNRPQFILGSRPGGDSRRTPPRTGPGAARSAGPPTGRRRPGRRSRSIRPCQIPLHRISSPTWYTTRVTTQAVSSWNRATIPVQVQLPDSLWMVARVAAQGM